MISFHVSVKYTLTWIAKKRETRKQEKKNKKTLIFIHWIEIACIF